MTIHLVSQTSRVTRVHALSPAIYPFRIQGTRNSCTKADPQPVNNLMSNSSYEQEEQREGGTLQEFLGYNEHRGRILAYPANNC